MTKLVLAGNGGFANRGCEAIERGTLEVLRARLDAPSFVVAPFGEEPQGVDCGPSCERIPRQMYGARRFTPSWAYKNALLRVSPRRALWKLFDFGALDDAIRSADVLLQLGGDNFSLDYGGPEPFMALNSYAYKRGCPVVIWGASVGPFDRTPEYEQWVIKEFDKVALFLVRETRTLEYLTRVGLGERTVLIADPAFAMSPVNPAARGLGQAVPSGAVGLNLSPLYARYAGVDASLWVSTCAEVAAAVVRATERPLVLVPHVIVPSENDHKLLAEVKQKLAAEGIETTLLPAELNAAELKWCIGQMDLLIGTRTHATIAAFSQAVPVVTLAYSVKAYGITDDLMGTTDYLVPATEFGPETVARAARGALDSAASIRAHLTQRATDHRARAFLAADVIADRLGLS